MRRPLSLSLSAIIALAGIIGCGGADTSYESAPPTDSKTAGTKGSSDGSGGSGKMELTPADVGVGIKGRSLDEYKEGTIEGAVAGKAKALFAFKEKAVFDFQVKPAIQLYKATNGNGPKSHEEFMTAIIKANNIQLPELPKGQRYVYDPEKEMLMVERPAN